MTAAVQETWLPASYTAPLSPNDFVSDGPKLRKFCELFWKTEDGKPFKLDPWQVWLIDAVLERYPDDWPNPELAGRLRYREAVISVGRQNGKSVFAAIFGLYGLMMHEAGPTVVGLASNADQANIIYRRVKYVIDNHRALRSRFKTTGTRGIRRLDKPGLYQIKPAKADALQGIPVTMCLFDEVHLCHPDMWQAMVKGTTAQDDGLVLGITTAGDDTSVLLKALYVRGRKAVAGNGEERLGFFCWEAPEGSAVDDPDAIKAANPSVMAGRIPLSRLVDQVRSEPDHQARRYTLNQFVSAQTAWLDAGKWLSLGSEGLPEAARPVLVVDRTPGQAHASVTAVAKHQGRFYSELVADIEDPTDERLFDECMRLNKLNPLTFVMDGYPLGNLAKRLEMYGVTVKVMRQGDIFNACAFAYRQIMTGNVSHDHDARVTSQMPKAAVKQYGDERWRIVRSKSGYIDMVLGVVFGLYVADTHVEIGLQVF